MELPPIATGGRAVNPAIAELAAISRWVCWKAVTRGDKVTKVPYTPAGSKAKSTDPRTWSTFDECFAAAFVDGRHDGIGFVFADDDDLCGVDLDDRIQGGAIEPEAAEIMAAFSSYAEISPSGAGLKIITRGKLPERGRRNANWRSTRRQRFFTITGDHFSGSPDRIVAAQPAIDALWQKHFSRPRTRPNGAGNSHHEDLPPYPDQAM